MTKDQNLETCRSQVNRLQGELKLMSKENAALHERLNKCNAEVCFVHMCAVIVRWERNVFHSKGCAFNLGYYATKSNFFLSVRVEIFVGSFLIISAFFLRAIHIALHIQRLNVVLKCCACLHRGELARLNCSFVVERVFPIYLQLDEICLCLPFLEALQRYRKKNYHSS